MAHKTDSPAQSPTRRLSSVCEPPTYSIDLSLPPESRYLEICAKFKAQLADILPIYDDILQSTAAPRILDFLARTFLRRVHSTEETREIRGIAKATGIPLHRVVAFNTFLDLFSACSSGGVRVVDAGNGHESGIVHFRALDWEMKPLRRLIICVEYVRESAIIARAVTYAGYVGVLTGVRQGLSISLNYRAPLDSPSSILSHRLHQTALLLGFRPSISSILRRILLTPTPPPSLSFLEQTLPRTRSTPCYLIFCSSSGVLAFEKDLRTAVPHTSADFLTVTNHDRRMEGVTPDAEGWHELLHQDSIKRKQCLVQWYETGMRLTVQDVARQLELRPIQNESTHFSCLMDPAVEGGGLLWVRAYSDCEPADTGIGSESASESDSLRVLR